MVPNGLWKARLGALVCLGILAGPGQGSTQQFVQYYHGNCSNASA